MARVVQFTAPRLVEVVDEPRPDLPPGQVRVRTLVSGISAGTELTAYRGSNPYLVRDWDPDARLFRAADGPRDPAYPLVGWGYSEVGEVIEVADDVPQHPAIPKVGEIVWGSWGHREEGILPAERLAGHRLPAGVSPLAGSFTRVGAIVYNAVLSAGAQLGETVAVFGQGVLGQLVTALLVRGGVDVIAVDTLAGRLDRAKALSSPPTSGGPLVHGVNPAETPVAERIRELTGGRGADVAIEISGSYAALHEAIRSVTVGGRVAAAGFYQGEGTALRLGEEFHHNRVQLESVQIGGVSPRLDGRWTVDRLQLTFLALLARGAIEVESLVSHRFPVERAAEAYDLLDTRPAEAGQLVLEFATPAGS